MRTDVGPSPPDQVRGRLLPSPWQGEGRTSAARTGEGKGNRKPLYCPLRFRRKLERDIKDIERIYGFPAKFFALVSDA